MSLKLNGKKINPNNMRNAIEQSIVESLQKSIKKSLGSLRCEEHHGYPHITLKGKSIDKLGFSVSGCCDGLIEKVKEKLKS